MRFHRHQRRVAVVGPARAGKTVLLTSLINHLKHHHPDHQFCLGRNGQNPELSFDCELAVGDGFARFPYEDHRHQLHGNRWWPVKTKGVSRFHFRYYRSDWHLSYGELDLIDFPGDRVVDLMMAGRGFGDWSGRILEALGQGSYADLARPYLQLFESDTIPPAGTILQTYRQMLVELLANYALRFNDRVTMQGTLTYKAIDRGETHAGLAVPARPRLQPADGRDPQI